MFKFIQALKQKKELARQQREKEKELELQHLKIKLEEAKNKKVLLQELNKVSEELLEVSPNSIRIISVPGIPKPKRLAASTFANALPNPWVMNLPALSDPVAAYIFSLINKSKSSSTPVT